MAICGRSVLSAIALASPMVEPPPSATRQSTPLFLTKANASSVTATGVCIVAPA